MRDFLQNWGEAIGLWLEAQSALALALWSLGSLALLFVLAAALLRVARNRIALQHHNSHLLAEVQQLQQALLGEQQRVAEQSQRLHTLAGVERELAASDSSRAMLVERSEHLDQELGQARSALSGLRAEHAALEARTRAEQKALGEQLQMLQQNRAQLVGDFELLANRIFEEKTQKFSQASKQQLDVTLTPLKNQLDDFRKRVDYVYGEEAKERKVLQEQIGQLRAESLRISEDANNLTRALKADNKAQGNWGELTLIRALETCGLREPEEYETQTSYKAEDNSRQVPDVVVHLPGGKDIIIDSKVSLVAYARFFEADTEEARSEALEQHLQSVRQHVRLLSDKSYQSLPGITTLDYVMLYIPVEGASAMALQADGRLWEEAYKKNIVLVSPTNLLAILRSVETIWRHEKQNKNAEEIARQAGNLHDKFVGLVSTLEAVGRALDTAQGAYDKAFSQLSTGKGNLVARVQKLEKLGAKTRATLPGKLVDAAGLDDPDVDTGEADNGPDLPRLENEVEAGVVSESSPVQKEKQKQKPEPVAEN